MMKILYILHADFETPGILEHWAKSNHFIEATCRPFAGETIPSPSDFDFLILMGGPQSPLNLKESPYLVDEFSLIKESVQQEKPILGFCLGAQLIGEAFGARTMKSPFKEVGAFPIELTEEGLCDPILRNWPKTLSVVHWHNDMPGLTAEAKILAASKGCPRQIIRYAPSIYGFQCHPEPTKTNMEEMIKHCPQDLDPGRYVQTAEEFLKHDFETMNKRMIQFMDHFYSKSVSPII